MEVTRLGSKSRRRTLRRMRVALKLPATDPDVTLRFSGNGEHAQVFGPVPANVVADDTDRFGMFWSPVLEGDVALIEIHAERGVRVPDAVLTVAMISHQVVAPASLQKLDAKAVQDIGMSGNCNIDVACVTPRTPAFVESSKAVAATEFTQDDGFTYLCTGTLLNDSLASNTPYFFSASHCLDSATAARTLNTFWFFDAVECGSTAVPPYVQQANGATMLARSADWDWGLVRLDADPPPGSRFAAWRAEPIPAFARCRCSIIPRAISRSGARERRNTAGGPRLPAGPRTYCSLLRSPTKSGQLQFGELDLLVELDPDPKLLERTLLAEFDHRRRDYLERFR